MFLIIWLSVAFISTVMSITGKKNYFNDYYSQFFNMKLNFNVTNYYPKDIFDEYMYFEIERIDSNNEIITFSEDKSFTENRFLGQKTIFAVINKQTFEDIFKRIKLCNYLIEYSSMNDIFNNTSDEISQTKLVLIFNEPQTYFTKYIYTYCYYYDNKNPKYSIYGGIQLDSLISSQKKLIDYKDKMLQEALLEGLNINEDSLKSIILDSTFHLTSNQLKLIQEAYNKLNGKGRVIPLFIIPFEDVKPIVSFSINTTKSEMHQVEFVNNYFWDDKFHEAIIWRDYINKTYFTE